MMNCPFCATQNSQGANFCSSCGSPLHLRVCARCEGVNDKTATTCINCGAALPAPEKTQPEAIASPVANRVQENELTTRMADGPAAGPDWESLLHNIDEEIYRLDSRGRLTPRNYVPPSQDISLTYDRSATAQPAAGGTLRLPLAGLRYLDATVIEPQRSGPRLSRLEQYAADEFDPDCPDALRPDRIDVEQLRPASFGKEQFSWTAPVLLIASAVIAGFAYLSLPPEPLGSLVQSVHGVKLGNGIANTLLSPGSLLVPDVQPDPVSTKLAIETPAGKPNPPATPPSEPAVPRTGGSLVSDDPLGMLLNAKMDTPDDSPNTATDTDAPGADKAGISNANPAKPSATVAPNITRTSLTTAVKSPRKPLRFQIITNPAKQAELEPVRRHLY